VDTTLELTPELVGAEITVTVTANRDSYDPVTVTTAASAPVAPGTFTVQRGPSVSGTARPGQTLYLDTGLYTPSTDQPGVHYDVQWLRDGTEVLNATGPTYRLTADDLGSKITARVTVSTAGYDPLVEASPATARVKTTAKLKLSRERLKHRVKLTIEVTSPDVPVVSGTVLVRIQGGFRQEVTLNKHGRAKLSVRDLPKGKHAMKLVYRATSTVARAVRTGNISTPPPKGSKRFRQ
jgi:hypothetical protein